MQGVITDPFNMNLTKKKKCRSHKYILCPTINITLSIQNFFKLALTNKVEYSL